MSKIKDTSATNKRIAKNTFVLYFRMIFLMLVQLYTTRVIINSLGDSDYGIFNVVGGVVIIFTVASRSISTTISRFFAYSIGEGDQTKLQKVFNTSIWMLLIFSFIVFLAMETIGLWFINFHLTIPSDRLYAANWVYQMAILSFSVSLLCTAYNALIIAHERMSTFAYISIFDAIMALGIAFLIKIYPFDRLILYSILIFLSGMFSFSIYFIYTKKHFPEAKVSFHIETKYIKQMLGFTSWTFTGALAHVLRFQGIDIILNIFLGPIINSAKSIAYSISTAVNRFVVNMMTSVNPQIIKSYADGNQEYLMTLIYNSAKYSYFMFLLIATPIFINAYYIINLWIGHVPEHCVAFLRLLLIQTILDSLMNPIDTAIMATGKIKKYEILTSAIIIANIPISCVLLFLELQPEMVFVSSIFLTVLCLLLKWHFLVPYGFNIKKFLASIVSRVLFVTALVVITCSYISNINISNQYNSLLSLIFNVIIVLSYIYFFGLNRTEKNTIFRIIIQKFN